LGKEHDGVKVIIEMIHGTRLDSATSSAALMRQALVQVNYFFSGNNYRIFFVFLILGNLACTSSKSIWSIINRSTINETSFN
jgi:hypothetical protein